MLLRIQKSGMKFQVELQRSLTGIGMKQIEKWLLCPGWIDSQISWSKGLQISILCPWKCNLSHGCALLCSKVSVKTQERRPGVVPGDTLKSLDLRHNSQKRWQRVGNPQGGFWKRDRGRDFAVTLNFYALSY